MNPLTSRDTEKLRYTLLQRGGGEVPSIGVTVPSSWTSRVRPVFLLGIVVAEFLPYEGGLRLVIPRVADFTEFEFNALPVQSRVIVSSRELFTVQAVTPSGDGGGTPLAIPRGRLEAAVVVSGGSDAGGLTLRSQFEPAQVTRAARSTAGRQPVTLTSTDGRVTARVRPAGDPNTLLLVDATVQWRMPEASPTGSVPLNADNVWPRAALGRVVRLWQALLSPQVLDVQATVQVGVVSSALALLTLRSTRPQPEELLRNVDGITVPTGAHIAPPESRATEAAWRRHRVPAAAQALREVRRARAQGQSLGDLDLNLTAQMSKLAGADASVEDLIEYAGRFWPSATPTVSISKERA